MNNFRLVFKSLSGYVTGYLQSVNDLSMAPSHGDPVYPAHGFTVWQPFSFDQTGIDLIWETYYKPCIRNMRGQTTIQGVLGLLNNDGATSAQNAAVLAEIQLQDSYGNPILSPSMCMRAYADNTSIRACLSKKEITGNTTTYTDLTPYSAVFTDDNHSNTIYLVGGIFTIAGTVSYGLGLVGKQFFQGIAKQCEGYCYLAKSDAFIEALGFGPQEEEIDPDLGPGSEPGGYGPGGGGAIGGIGGPEPTFDFTSDPIDITPLPPSISALGFTNIYKCSTGALNALGATLFPDVSSSTDVWSAIVALSDSIWNSKLIDYVVSIHMVPCNVPAGNPEDIKIGTRTLMGIQGGKVTSDYVEVDLGSLKIDETYTSFVDYNCSRARLFLPFYGFVEIKPEYWQSATLNIMYRINVIDGSFLAIVKSTVNRHQPEMSSIVGQYSGCACIHCPASGVSYASMFGGMVSNAGGLGVSMASGNVTGVASSALNMAAASQGNMEHSNPYNASSSIMGHAYPYLLIERPVSQFPINYGKEHGYPLWVTTSLNTCSGLTICDNPILNFGCTEEEGKAIIAALKEGVIL